jgi:Fe2+ or Zn2+ uptake regulation protein
MCTSTHSGPWRPLAHEERDRLTDALRLRGLHLTPQREAIFEVVFGCPGHICAEHILGAVAELRPTMHMNKTTVYRSLDLLVGLQFVSEHKVGDGPAQYESSSRGQHSHIICRRCGTSEDLDEEILLTLRDQVRSLHGFEADLASHPIFGLCGSCRS